MDHYPRYILPALRAELEDSPAVLIHGARQTGKTTLAQSLGEEYGYVNFDNPALVELAHADPTGFIEGLPQRVILDEVQRVPEIFSILKMEIDRNRQPGRFLLTGSANILMLPGLSDSLAGRMALLRLYPLAQAEIERTRGNMIDRFFDGGLEPRLSPVEEQEERENRRFLLAERIVTGGYPSAIQRENNWRRVKWYQDYVDTLVQKDVRDLTRIHGLDVIPDLLTIAAGQTARLVRISAMATKLPQSRPTIDAYVSLLGGLFLIDQLPAWSNNRMKRLVKTPKLHMSDTGLAAALLGVDAVGLQNDGELFGQFFETFVYQELRRQASWYREPTRFYHYRDRDQVEVDLILERGGRSIVGVEVKTSTNVRADDFKGLKKIAAAAGEGFRGGIVIYPGTSLLSFGEKMYALPVSDLWTTDKRS